MLLLDEPFGALDVQTKEDMQVLIRRVWRDTGTTVLMVTHDVEEAVFLGQRVVVLASDPGRVAADLTGRAARRPRPHGQARTRLPGPARLGRGPGAHPSRQLVGPQPRSATGSAAAHPEGAEMRHRAERPSRQPVAPNALIVPASSQPARSR